MSRVGAVLPLDVALFVAIAALLVTLNWTAIDQNHLEYGDFAANSVLMQYAKAAPLMIGNYSRVGFNHPGPAILDVLASGEAVLYDRLRWVPSPFSGQLVVVAFYNAFWITLVVRSWRTFTTSRTAAVAGAAGFVTATALLDVRFFNGPWFPHLYYFPFATFLFAATRLATGRTDRLPALAISLGFLMNGHVAFVPICYVVLAIAVLANRSTHRRAEPDRVVASAAWMRRHARSLSFACLTIGLFATPLAVETWRHFPGPVADYASFGSAHHRNNFIRSLRFVAMYWGGLAFALPAVLFFATGFRLRFDDGAWSTAVRAMLAVGSAASVALLLYAHFGVDELSAVYIGYFYCAVPAMVLALCVGSAFRRATSMRLRNAALFLGVVAFLIACVGLRRESDYRHYYGGVEIAAMADELHRARRGSRLVMDIEGWPGFKTVWPVAVGIQLEALRRHEPMCIGANWHILFSRQAQCTAAEIAESAHAVIRNASTPRAANETPIAEGLGMSIYLVDR